MLRAALFTAAGLLAAICFACVPPPVPGSSLPSPLLATRAAHDVAVAMCGSKDPFLNHVQLLNSNTRYQPTNGNGQFNPPPGQAYTWPQPVQDDLNEAFNRAPHSFQARLCGATALYILCPVNGQGACDFATASPIFDNYAFGFRDPDNPQNTYLGISAGLWSATGTPPQATHAMPLHAYETAVLQSFNGGQDSSIDSATPDDPWMTVMAALAHEMGHIVWVQTVRAPGTPINSGYNFSSLIGCRPRDFFLGWNYSHSSSTHPHLQPRNGWRPFHDRSNNAPSNSYVLDHLYRPLLSYLDHSSPPQSDQYLYSLYTTYSVTGQVYDQPWASLFGAQTPDEDFVETYVMAVLMGYDPATHTFMGPLASLPVTIPNTAGLGPPPDVPAALLNKTKPTLAGKMSCINY